MNASFSVQLDDFVCAFEAAAVSDDAALQDHLPPRDHSLYLPVLRELVRIDLELRWTAGRPRPLADYLRAHPELALDRVSLAEIAYEEYRLRRLAGQQPRPEEYAAEYGVNASGWYAPAGSSAPEKPGPTVVVEPGEPNVSFEVRCDDPDRFPEPGETFAGFSLESELGRGSFARVFLAREKELSARPVVLKTSADAFVGEAHTLARLQHTNVVPIYSLHREGRLYGLVMPFFGVTTLSAVLRQMRQEKMPPRSGAWLGGYLPKRDGGYRTHAHASLWLIAQLAEGLAHAHERGIIHRDVKPANVLLADDGTPMLLDFNLADDQGGERGRAGGTLPYLSPEYLDSLCRGDALADPRGDVFALGVVLYELLTGRQPFPTRPDSLPELLPLMAADRRAGGEDVRTYNHAVDAGTAAIVKRCLEADPARRYQSARELIDDVERHLSDRPLKHAREPASRRLRKWTRRHRVLLSYGTVVAAAAACVLLVALVYAGWRARQGLTAEREWARVKEESDQITFLLADRHATAFLDDGVGRCDALAAVYGVLARDDWQAGPLVAALPAAARAELLARLGEILWLWARADDWRKGKPDAESWRLLDRAAGCFGADDLPPVLARLRAAWLKREGKQSDVTPRLSRTQRERYLDLLALAEEKRWPEMLPALREQTKTHGDKPLTWLLLANAYDELGERASSRFCAELGTSLASDWYAAWLHQGTLALRRNDFNEARRCFEEVLKRRPGTAEARVNLALAEIGLGRPKAALAHLERALEGGSAITRIYLIRARIHRLSGDEDAVRQDLGRLRERAPSNDADRHARALSWLPPWGNDPKVALAELDALVADDPTWPLPLRDRAHVLSEHLDRPADAVADLDRVLQMVPNDLIARAGRAVLLARLGKRQAAHEDAQIVEKTANEAGFVYQAACAYALTARGRRADRVPALRLLRKAFQQEARWIDVAPNDPDLKSLHRDPDFLDLLKNARAMELLPGASAPGY